MKIEKVKYLDSEINIPILDDDEIEENIELDDTIDLTPIIENIGDSKNE